MSDEIHTRNIKGLHSELVTTQANVRDLTNRVTKLEGNLTLALAELANAKQLMAHVMGRGMGSTTE
jgi:hypothetical protein